MTGTLFTSARCTARSSSLRPSCRTIRRRSSHGSRARASPEAPRWVSRTESNSQPDLMPLAVPVQRHLLQVRHRYASSCDGDPALFSDAVADLILKDTSIWMYGGAGRSDHYAMKVRLACSVPSGCQAQCSRSAGGAARAQGTEGCVRRQRDRHPPAAGLPHHIPRLLPHLHHPPADRYLRWCIGALERTHTCGRYQHNHIRL